LRAVGQSDVGRVRTNNEDAFGIWSHQGLAIVADGMGGHEAGEVASQQAVETIHRELAAREAAESPRTRLRNAVETANREILLSARERGNDMGTTATVAWVLDDRVHIAQVGDSRAYLLRDGELTQLTEDHSMVNELVTAGVLTPDSAETHPGRHILTRALGQSDPVEVDVISRVLDPEDVLLLCSDGLTTMLSDGEICEIVVNRDDPGQAVDELIDKANERGGQDNTTVVIADRFGERSKRGKRLNLLSGAVPLGGLAVVGLAAYLLLSQTFFLAPHGDRVALYRGLPVSVGSHRLASLISDTAVQVDSLGAPYAERVRRGMLVASPSAGETLLRQIAGEPTTPEQT